MSLKNFEAILQYNLAQIAKNLAVTLKIESSYGHALRLCEELRYVIEALALIRGGIVVSLKGEKYEERIRG